MKSINPDPLTPDQAIDILHRAAAAEGAPIFKDCADVIVSLEKLRTQNEALTKEVEELKAANDYNDTDLPLDELMGGISDTVMDFKPDCESDSAGTILERVQAAAELGKAASKLRTQKQELREALLNVLGVTQHWAGCGAWTNGPCDCIRLVITKALAQTEVKP